MAKRFTDTDKWKDAWFTELEPTMKIFWVYLCDTCDHAGVWKVNFRVASAIIGAILDKQSALKALGDRVYVITEEKWLLSKFISFQYPGGLNPKSSVHRGVIKALESNGIEHKPYLTLIEALPNPSVRIKDKDLVLDKDSSNSYLKTGIQKSAHELVSNIFGNATVDSVIESYNSILAGEGKLRHCRGLGPNDLRELLNSFSRFPNTQDWVELFELVKANSTLTGKSKTVFLASMDWLAKLDNALKVSSGKYEIPTASEASEASVKSHLDSIKLA